MAVEAYEKRRPADSVRVHSGDHMDLATGDAAEVMHHYWVKEAGDPEAIGEYFPTGDERNGVPLYQNQPEPYMVYASMLGAGRLQ